MKFFNMRMLEGVERTVVIIASLAALVPIYQWYSEAEARRIDRMSTFATAGQSCYEWYGSLLNAPEYNPINKALEGTKWEDLNEKSLEGYFKQIRTEDWGQILLNSGMRPVCSEMVKILREDEYIAKLIWDELVRWKELSADVDENSFREMIEKSKVSNNKDENSALE